jgi:hypothetical protein
VLSTFQHGEELDSATTSRYRAWPAGCSFVAALRTGTSVAAATASLGGAAAGHRLGDEWSVWSWGRTTRCAGGAQVSDDASGAGPTTTS